MKLAIALLVFVGYTSGIYAQVFTVDSSGNATVATLTSTVATGTAPLTVTSTTTVPNLSASSLANGATFAAPGPIGGTTPGTGAFTALSGSQLNGSAGDGAIPITGTNTNDSAAGGNIGEYISAQRLQSAAVSVTYATPINVTSITLTAGDWDVVLIGWVGYSPSNTINEVMYAIETTSGGAPSTHADQIGGTNYFGLTATGFFSPSEISLPTAPMRVSISSTTTFYGNLQINGSGGNPIAWGQMRARRVR